MFVCVFGTPVTFAKTTESVAMPFTRQDVGPKGCTLVPPGEYDGFICAAAVMQLLLPTCFA